MSLLGVLIIFLILFEIALIVITIWQMTTYSIKEIPWQLWVNFGLIFVIIIISIGIGFAYYRESNITKILTPEKFGPTRTYTEGVKAQFVEH